MSIIEALRIALGALAANKMRSGLTTLGVVIGVAAVIAMVALGEGARRDIQERIGKMGSNLLFVAPGQAERGHIWHGFGSAKTLTVDEAVALRHTVPEIAGVAPEISRNQQVKIGNKNGDFNIVGTFADFRFVRNVPMQSGRFFTALDDEIPPPCGGARLRSQRHALRGRWGRSASASKIKNIPFTVVGVLEPRGGRSRDDQVIVIPMTTMRQRFNSTSTSR